MKNTFTQRKIVVAFAVVIFMIGGITKTKAQLPMLNCFDPSITNLLITSATNDSVWGCDGNCYLNDTTAIFQNGVTHMTHDQCNNLFPVCHADFLVEDVLGIMYFTDSGCVYNFTPEYIIDYGDGLIDTFPSLAGIAHDYYYSGFYVVSLTLNDWLGGTIMFTSKSTRVILVDTSYGSNNTNNSFYTYLYPVFPNCTSNGSITANIYGGTAPFSFLWSNGQINQTITGLGPGSYSVTVTDNTGLTATGIYYLYQACYNVLEGNLYNDANGNCIFDSGEVPLQNVNVTASNGTQIFFGYCNQNGQYSIDIPLAGTYDINVYSSNFGYDTCQGFIACSANTVTFPSVGDTITGNNIGFAVSTAHDLGIFVNWSGANPGFQMHYNLFPYDFSIPAFTGLETVTFQYDPQLVYDSSNNAQVAHNITNHTLTHVGAGAANWYFGAPPITCYFTVPVGTPTNYMVQSDFYIGPVFNDCDTTNNHLHTSGIVTGSYDPNEKTVSPAGNITSADSVLTYTIHFQNTGNDTTHFVIVTDTLPSALDPTTVVNLASSAPFSEFTISGTGILKWVFNPLFLPDSTTNEPASKGFVMFKIKVKPNLPFGTTINNKASIYFDYNTAVITNYATNSIINGVEEITVNSEQLIVYPNPATDEVIINSPLSIINYIVVTDVLGREIYSQPANAQSSTINCQLFSSGVYFIKVQLGNGSVEVRRFVKE